MKTILSTAILFIILSISVFAADVVPPEIELPGTQPKEVQAFESPVKCDFCHGLYNGGDPVTEPYSGWSGSPMGNAGRDPIFWATLAIAEQDFDGSGDFCIRCHSTGGWYDGRSKPTDGSGLNADDDNGVDCDTCHLMTNPDDSELPGVMNPPYIANNNGEAFNGSGMLALTNEFGKLGPYAADDARPRHEFSPSPFQRSVDFCGTCHDVSNSAVGDLAPNHGTQPGSDPVISSYDFPPVGSPNLGGPVEEKAAFNNPPYKYGIVERTFSEYKSSVFDTTLVSDFTALPADLQVPGGSLEVSYQAAMAAGKNGNYEDGTPRYFSCQTCHMRPAVGKGSTMSNTPYRKDLPRHDITGGNYWEADIIRYQDEKGLLRLGGGLDARHMAAIEAGRQGAMDNLNQSASLEITDNGNTLKVINLTGHKLITGYPEGRRMWLNIQWYDADNNLIREEGAYGLLSDKNGNAVMVYNPSTEQMAQVESIKDLYDPNTKIYEAHYSMTKEWADVLLAVGYPGDLVLSYDRYTGAPDFTLADLAALETGGYHKTFHFVLNDHVSMDNRIPPYGMDYEEARKRNILPVPYDQYGGTPGGSYNYWDEVPLNPPSGARRADISLLYQGTTWEYIQFLYLANNGQNEFLGEEGEKMLDAWLNTGMVKPYVMETITWEETACTPTGTSETICNGIDEDCDGSVDEEYTAASTTCGKGACTGNPGQLICQGGREVDTCDPLAGAAADDSSCNGIDEDCDGSMDEDYMATPTECGDGECASTGQFECRNGEVVNTCTPGEPQTEGPYDAPSCFDGKDNDCDALTDSEDQDCAVPAMQCSDYKDRNSCQSDLNCTWKTDRWAYIRSLICNWMKKMGWRSGLTCDSFIESGTCEIR